MNRRVTDCGSTHLDLPSGWRCASCALDLCSHCTAVGVIGLPVCATCGQGVETLYVTRAEAFPWEDG